MLKLVGKREQTGDPRLLERLQEQQAELELLRKRTAELERERDKALRERAETEEALRCSRDTIQLFLTLMPPLQDLTEYLAGKTEEDTLSLTESIFALSEKNREIGSHIEENLKGFSEGDTSLEAEAEQLRQEIELLQQVSEKFNIATAKTEESEAIIVKSTRQLHQYADTIVDLAEKTTVLAINAAIVAARAGRSGEGFAIIATEVHQLAQRSKEIAGDMEGTFSSIDQVIHQACGEQKEYLTQAQERLRESRATLAAMSEGLKPQLNSIKGSIKDAGELNSYVNEKLSQITMSLQGQDYIRQGLGHVISLLMEVQGRFEKEGKGFEEGSDQEFKELLKQWAEQYFTMKEEFEIFGLDESYRTEEKSVNNQDNLQGDITLF